MTRSKAKLIGTAAVVGVCATLFWLERGRPLRPRVDAGPRRLLRNAAIAGLTAVSVATLERPVTRRLTALVERRHWGMLPHSGLRPPVREAFALVLMDWTLYWWHVLLHRVPLLWRLHLPHHSDRDLDTSTALRFHCGEFIASIPWRCAQVLAIGVTSRELALWQKATLIEVLFHHANVRLPLRLERLLSAFVVTPRMHGIHHSVVQAQRDANFSSGLAVWDRLHGTASHDLAVPQPVIGVPACMRAADVTLAATLALPFQSHRPGSGGAG
jgi:sterol desaturase/sphingolipid hydroxylase (fatty acid hydroxylase superfamily)